MLIDTSAWIDYLRGASTEVARSVETILGDEVPFWITGVIYQEILQGADSPESQERLAEYFGTQRFVHPLDPVASYAQAAALYGRCRRMGITVRSTIDCLIAQIAIEHDLALLHDDRDFSNLARAVPELRLHQTGRRPG